MNLFEKYSLKIESLSNLDEVYGVYIFGSYAKGKRISKKSDIDICFFINPNNENLVRELISEGNDELDIQIFHKLPLSIQFDILKTGKIFKINDKINFKEQKMKTLRKYKDESWVFKNIYYSRYGVRI